MLRSHSVNHNDISIVKPAFLWRYFIVAVTETNCVGFIRHSITIPIMTYECVWASVQAVIWALAFLIIGTAVGHCARYVQILFISWWSGRATSIAICCTWCLCCTRYTRCTCFTVCPPFFSIFNDARDKQCQVVLKECSIKYGLHFSKPKRSKPLAEVLNVQIGFLQKVPRTKRYDSISD